MGDGEKATDNPIRRVSGFGLCCHPGDWSRKVTDQPGNPDPLGIPCPKCGAVMDWCDDDGKSGHVGREVEVRWD